MTPERIAELRTMADRSKVVRPEKQAGACLSEALDEIERLRKALDRLAMAASDYRLQHDSHGDGSPQAGLAWDHLRQADSGARKLLDAVPTKAKANPCVHCDGTGMPLEFRTSGHGRQDCRHCDGKGNANA